jgi:hypothetical protein
VPRYIVEAYVADSLTAMTELHEQAARAAVLGRGVRHLRTTFIPGDETVLHVFEAPSLAAMRRATGRADLRCERIVEAVESSESQR